MKADIRRQLSMARRALDYANANPIDDNGFKVALQRLDAAVTQATNLGLQETGGTTGQHSGVVQRDAARRKIRAEFLVRLVEIGQMAADTDAALLGLFILPYGEEPNKTFLFHARTLLTLATEHADLLVPMGLGDTFVVDLGAALDQFEAIGRAIDTGHGQHVGASKTFQKAISKCRSCIKVVDTYYRAAATPDSAVLAGWTNARTVEGPFVRSHDAGGLPAPEPAPVPAQLQLPAASAPAADPEPSAGPAGEAQ
ncbi:MAG TPA: hypothetical protein VGL65_05770 [Gemmatimonadales bacterium]